MVFFPLVVMEHEAAIRRLRAEYDRPLVRLHVMYLGKLNGKVDRAIFDRRSAEWRAEQNLLRHQDLAQKFRSEKGAMSVSCPSSRCLFLLLFDQPSLDAGAPIKDAATDVRDWRTLLESLPAFEGDGRNVQLGREFFRCQVVVKQSRRRCVGPKRRTPARPRSELWHLIGDRRGDEHISAMIPNVIPGVGDAFTVAVKPDGSEVYVTNLASNAVSVIDTPMNTSAP
jgi:hypothetical protein